MHTTTLCAADLTRETLIELLGSLRFPADHPTRAWLDGVDGWSLDYWTGLDGQVDWCSAGCLPRSVPVRDVLTRVVGGRLFAPAGELRWRWLPALGACPFRTVYLGTPLDVLGPLGPARDLSGLHARKSCFPLWGLPTQARAGDRESPAWIELRIPHRFRYPVESTGRTGRATVLAEVETWTDDRGDPQFVRLCDLFTSGEDN